MNQRKTARGSAGNRRPFRESGKAQTVWALVVALGFALLLLLQKGPTPSAATSIEPARERVPSHASMTEKS